MRQTKQKVRCLEINSMLGSIIIYEKSIKYFLSEEKQESDVLPPKQENL